MDVLALPRMQAGCPCQNRGATWQKQLQKQKLVSVSSAGLLELSGLSTKSHVVSHLLSSILEVPRQEPSCNQHRKQSMAFTAGETGKCSMAGNQSSVGLAGIKSERSVIFGTNFMGRDKRLSGIIPRGGSTVSSNGHYGHRRSRSEVIVNAVSGKGRTVKTGSVKTGSVKTGSVKNSAVSWELLDSMADICFLSDLEEGDVGPEVTALQKTLLQLGHLRKQDFVTGRFGAETKSALVDFQVKHGVPTNGKWCLKTRTAFCTYFRDLTDSSLKKSLEQSASSSSTGSQEISEFTASIGTNPFPLAMKLRIGDLLGRTGPWFKVLCVSTLIIATFVSFTNLVIHKVFAPRKHRRRIRTHSWEFEEVKTSKKRAGKSGTGKSNSQISTFGNNEKGVQETVHGGRQIFGFGYIPGILGPSETTFVEGGASPSTSRFDFRKRVTSVSLERIERVSKEREDSGLLIEPVHIEKSEENHVSGLNEKILVTSGKKAEIVSTEIRTVGNPKSTENGALNGAVNGAVNGGVSVQNRTWRREISNMMLSRRRQSWIKQVKKFARSFFKGQDNEEEEDDEPPGLWVGGVPRISEEAAATLLSEREGEDSLSRGSTTPLQGGEGESLRDIQFERGRHVGERGGMGESSQKSARVSQNSEEVTEVVEGPLHKRLVEMKRLLGASHEDREALLNTVQDMRRRTVQLEAHASLENQSARVLQKELWILQDSHEALVTSLKKNFRSSGAARAAAALVYQDWEVNGTGSPVNQ